MARLELEGVSKHYGTNAVVKAVSLTVEDGSFVVLLGPSGCGKTTTLRMIAGFIEPSAGAIRIGARDVTRVPPWRRNAGLVFQSYALFPHLTVEENIAFGLEMLSRPKAEVAASVAEALKLVRLEGFGARYPRQLSGGQQQRVALARALAIRPDVLLLDEPLSNLDAKLRQEVRVEIRELQRRLGLTAIMVTHDQEEALTMADRLVVMADGEVQQTGTQRDLYERPANRFVAGFVGRGVFIRGMAAPGGRFTSDGGLEIAAPAAEVAGPAVLTLRPERLSLGHWPADPAKAGQPGANSFAGQVEFVSYLGAFLEAHVSLSATERVIVQTGNQASAAPAMGDKVVVSWPAGAGHVFPA